jgi:pimeloyl-ACP methyl ester carboxylesterase
VALSVESDNFRACRGNVQFRIEFAFLPAEPHPATKLTNDITMNALTQPLVTQFGAADRADMLAAQKRSNAAFFSSSGIAVLRRFNRVLCRVAPGTAAVLARRLIGTPPRHAPRKWEVELIATAARSTVTVGRRTISVAVWGQGPTVLLVHSWGGRGTQMGRFVQPLTDAGRRVVAFDLPAHGDAGAGETDMVECAAAVAAVVEAQCASGHEVSAAIAHSFGVMTALLASREYGFAIPKLVSIGAFESCRWFIDAAQAHLELSDSVAARLRDNFEARHGYRMTWDTLSVVEMLRFSRAQALVIHDRFDREIPYEHSYSLRRVGQLVNHLATVGLGHRRILGDSAVIARSVAYVS